MKVVKLIKEKCCDMWYWWIDNSEDVIVFIITIMGIAVFVLLIIAMCIGLYGDCKNINKCDICHSRLIPISHEDNKVWYQCPNYNCGYGKYKEVNENESK